MKIIHGSDQIKSPIKLATISMTAKLSVQIWMAMHFINKKLIFSFL